ncbi:hypothetical protein KCU88_g443, partial [Aureobasidium melanogenum]
LLTTSSRSPATKAAVCNASDFKFMLVERGVELVVQAFRRMSSRAFSSGAVTSNSLVVAISTRDHEMISCNTGTILSAVNAARSARVRSKASVFTSPPPVVEAFSESRSWADIVKSVAWQSFQRRQICRGGNVIDLVNLPLSDPFDSKPIFAPQFDTLAWDVSRVTTPPHLSRSESPSRVDGSTSICWTENHAIANRAGPVPSGMLSFVMVSSSPALSSAPVDEAIALPNS